MKKIRLLTISPISEIGGSDITLLRLLRNLDKNEYEILHLMPYPGPLIDEFRSAGIRVEIIDMPRIRLFKNPLQYIIVLLKFFPTVFKIKKIIEDCKIDLVCTFSMSSLYGALAAKLANRPHVLFANEYLAVLRLVSHYFYLLSEKVICCSSIVSTMFKKSNKIMVIPPGIDLHEFSAQVSNDKVRQDLGVNGNLVSMVTRLAPWKGVEIFIKAASYVKVNTKFAIFAQPVMGKERYLFKLEKLIQKLGLQDRVLIKAGGNKDIAQVMAASDIIVHASLRPEPFGLVIIEAMAMQKPIIASRLGAPLEIISDGVDGKLIEPGNPKALAAAISTLLENHALALEMGLYARKKVTRNFDIQNFVHSLDIIFKTILKDNYL